MFLKVRIKKLQYNSGNYEKYMTKNPLKRKMVKRFNRKLLQIIADEISTMESSKIEILDAGCGEGFIDAIILEKFPNVQITGLEYNEEALEIACEMNEEITYLNGDITNMPFKEDFFGLVICTEVLEHLENPQKAMNELIRV